MFFLHLLGIFVGSVLFFIHPLKILILKTHRTAENIQETSNKNID